MHKTIEINATKAQVWNVLMDDSLLRQWYAAFKPGTYAVTDWQPGSKALFLDGNGDGMMGKIAINRPCEELDIELLGMVKGGVEDVTSDMAKMVAGGHEVYHLTEANGQTVFEMTATPDGPHLEFLSVSWDAALQIIKRLAETI